VISCLSRVEPLPLSWETEILLLPDRFWLFTWLLDLSGEVLFIFWFNFQTIRFVRIVVNALIKGEIEDQWWSSLCDE